MGWHNDAPGPGGFESRRRRSSVPLPEERARDSSNEDSGEIGCIPEEETGVRRMPEEETGVRCMSEEETGVTAHDRSDYSENSQDPQVIERRYSCGQQELITTAARPHLQRAPSPVTENARIKLISDIHREPPVTKNTLSELDVHKIVHNPKLRHDINFDPELHFRPNLDGEKGRRKTQKANDFWHTLCRQLEVFITNRAVFEEEVRDAEWCLPATLNAIRGILETLVPQRDRPSVEEIFNVDLLMQQFTKGVANLEKLALWLSQLLKSHCAPMRDEWVDEMVNQLSNGDRNGDIGLLVAGMRTLLGVLEAMKLDVANHQIRCLRPLLIEDTVPFEQKFFLKKIGQGRFDIGRAHAWFRTASRQTVALPQELCGAFHGDIWTFMRALVRLMLPLRSTATISMPQTFMFDEERIIKLRSEMLDAIHLEICMRLCQELEAEARSTRTADSLTPDEFSSSPSTQQSPSISPRSSTSCPELLSSPTLPTPEDFFNLKLTRSSSARQKQRRTATSSAVRGRPLSTGRPLSSMQFPSRSSSTSSSLSTTSSSTPISTPTTPYNPITSSPPIANNLRSAIFAILGDNEGDARWKLHSPALALQILRSTPTHLSRLPQFEEILKYHLSNPDSNVYQEAETTVLGNLFSVLSPTVGTYSSMTSLQVFEAATTPRSGNHALNSSVWASQNSLNDVAIRIAHIGILHWRVWAPLAYLVNPDGDSDVEVEENASSFGEGHGDRNGEGRNAEANLHGAVTSQGSNNTLNPERRDSTSGISTETNI